MPSAFDQSSDRYIQVDHEDQLREYLRELIKNTPESVVSLDSGGFPQYSDRIRTGRPPRRDGTEEFVRAIIVMHIVYELEYKPEDIVLEYGVRARVGSRRQGNNYVDIAITETGNGNERIWALIECKGEMEYEGNRKQTWEQQLFNISRFIENGPVEVLTYATARTDIDGAVHLTLEVVSARSHSNFQKWIDNGEPFASSDIPRNFGQPVKIPLIRDSEHDLRTDVTRSELHGVRTRIHDVLWGGGASSDADIFNLLTRMILAKIQDEHSTRKGEKYNFQILNGEDVIRDTLERINDLYRTSLTSRLRVSPEDAKKKSVREGNKGTKGQIRFAIQSLEKFNLVELAKENRDDLLGSFFEEILRTGFKQSKGQFFTHPNIVQCLIGGVDLVKWTIDRVRKGEDLPSVIDPSAGSGTFLIEAMKEMGEGLRKIERDFSVGDENLSPEAEHKLKKYLNFVVRRNEWAAQFLYGMEINEDLGLAAQVNMMLHADGASSILAGSLHGDGLAPFNEYPHDTPKFSHIMERDDYDGKVNECFDVVLANPPFSAKYTEDDWRRYSRSMTLTENTKKSEDLFIERWFQLLKPKGRLGAVIPNSLLDNKKSHGRSFLLERFHLRAIVSLPADAFYPYTATKTSLIFAEKKENSDTPPPPPFYLEDPLTLDINVLPEEKKQSPKTTLRM